MFFALSRNRVAACLLSCHVPGNGWEMICYYKILGISIRASQDEIKKAFRMLAFRFHPDMNPADPDAARRFREVLKAYETLVDPRLRGKYDSLRGYSGRKGREAEFPVRNGTTGMQVSTMFCMSFSASSTVPPRKEGAVICVLTCSFHTWRFRREPSRRFVMRGGYSAANAWETGRKGR